MHILRQFSRFALVGGLNTVVDLSVYLVLTRLTSFWAAHQITAAVVSVSIATLNSYAWNKRWTFKNRSSSHAAIFSRFVAATLLGLGLHSLVFSAALSTGLHDIFAKTIAIAIVMLWNFGMYKFWAFAKE